jgi:acyl-CoA dehydrogenase
VQDWIAQARVRIEQARLLTLKAAWLMDTVGNGVPVSRSRRSRSWPRRWPSGCSTRRSRPTAAAASRDDFPLALMWAHARTLRMADGPDEVHEMALARREMARILD